jgi:hypothetical protein
MRDRVPIAAEGSGRAIVSFDLKDAGSLRVFACMDRMKMIVRGTSLAMCTRLLFTGHKLAP